MSGEFCLLISISMKKKCLKQRNSNLSSVQAKNRFRWFLVAVLIIAAVVVAVVALVVVVILDGSLLLTFSTKTKVNFKI